MALAPLPPCRICGAKASGLHFGVNTCEACKAFFRRSLGKFESFKCNNDKTCELPPDRRNFCSYCRFKKCVVLGMCRDAIKTGRYTCQKKASDIEELKGVREWTAPEVRRQEELQHRLTKLQKEHELLIKNPELNKYRKVTKQKKQRGRKAKSAKLNKIDGEIEGSGESSQATPSSGDDSNSSGCEVLSLTVDSLMDFSSMTIVSTNAQICEDTDVVVNIIHQLAETYRACRLFTQEFVDSMKEKEQEYIRHRETTKEVFGALRTLSRAEYLSVYESMGIDIDGRREILEHSLPYIDAGMKRSVGFVQAVPGFSNLNQDDQILLVRATNFYSWMVLNYHTFNPELGLMIGAGGRVVSSEDMEMFDDVEHINATFDIARKIRNLNLNDEEAATFCALTIITSDLEKLENSEIGETSQSLLLRCVRHVLDTYHPGGTSGSMRFAQFIDCLLYMRTRRDALIKVEQKFVQDWERVLTFPPFLYELWGGGSFLNPDYYLV